MFHKKVSVSGNNSPFVVPLSAIKNGPADLRFDPVAIFNQKLQEHVDGGGSKADFLQKEQIFSVERPISLGAHCYFAGKNTTTGGAWETVTIPLTVRYEGDPAIFETPALNAQLGQGQGMPNQIGGGYQPLKITQMNFQPNMPHHIGACPATTTIRLQYEAVGKGTIRIVIYDGAKVIEGPMNFLYDASNEQDYYYFDIETPKPAPFNINKTVSHTLRVEARVKDWKSQTWEGAMQQMDQAIWNVRCTPQVNPVLGGGGKVGGYKNGADGAKPAPSLQLKQSQPQQATPIIRRTQ